MATDRAKEELEATLARLENERAELEAALPPHSLQPSLLQRLEEVEDRIRAVEAALKAI